MKIIHFVSASGVSGLEIVSMNILRELAKDHEVYYSCPDGEGIERARSLGLGAIVCNTRSVGDIKRVCKEYMPDIVHAHDPAVSFTCALANINFVSHLHSDCLWLPKLCVNSLALLYVCIKAKKIICVSESIIGNFIFKKALMKKAVPLVNYVDRDVIVEASKEECNENYDISFVGRLTEPKQPLKFVEIIKRVSHVIKDIKAVVVGDGDLRDSVNEAILQNDLSNNIVLKGYDANPHKYVSKSRVGVMTSKYEGLPLAAVEAMVLGKPFVAFPVGGLATIVNEKNGLLCNSDDEMVDEIVRLLSDKEYYESKSANAAAYSHNFTDKVGYINKILEIYNETKKGR